MHRPNRRLIVGAAAVLLVFALWVTVRAILPSDEELRQTAEAQIERRLGVAATIGALGWRLLPAPEVTLSDVMFAQSQPLTLRRLSIYPALGRSLRREHHDRAHRVDGAFPHVSLRAFRRRNPAPGGTHRSPGRQPQVSRPTGLAHRDLRSAGGRIDFDEQWRPRAAE